MTTTSGGALLLEAFLAQGGDARARGGAFQPAVQELVGAPRPVASWDCLMLRWERLVTALGAAGAGARALALPGLMLFQLCSALNPNPSRHADLLLRGAEEIAPRFMHVSVPGQGSLLRPHEALLSCSRGC